MVHARQAKQGAVDIEGQMLLPNFQLDNEMVRPLNDFIRENSNEPEIVRTVVRPKSQQRQGSRNSERYGDALSLNRMQSLFGQVH